MSTDTPLNRPTDSSTAKERATANSKEDALIYRSILVPVDFSENSEKAVSYVNPNSEVSMARDCCPTPSEFGLVSRCMSEYFGRLQHFSLWTEHDRVG